MNGLEAESDMKRGVSSVLQHGISHGHRARHVVRGGDDLTTDLRTFVGIAPDDGVTGDATCDECDLPGEIDRVLNAGVHSMSPRGTVRVGGISGDEHPASAVSIEHSLPHSEGCEPRGIGEREIEHGPSTDDFSQGLELGDGAFLDGVVIDDDAISRSVDGKEDAQTVGVREVGRDAFGGRGNPIATAGDDHSSESSDDSEDSGDDAEDVADSDSMSEGEDDVDDDASVRRTQGTARARSSKKRKRAIAAAEAAAGAGCRGALAAPRL